MFQYWNKKNLNNYPISKIFASKDKLSILTDCSDSTWNGYYRPSSDCGVNGMGVGSGYRYWKWKDFEGAIY